MGLSKTGPKRRLVFRHKQEPERVGGSMSKRKFAVEQIVGVLKQAEVGAPVAP